MHRDVFKWFRDKRDAVLDSDSGACILTWIFLYLTEQAGGSEAGSSDSEATLRDWEDASSIEHGLKKSSPK